MAIPIPIQAVQDRAICLFTKKEIEASLAAMACILHEKLSSCNPIVLCVMISGIITTGNLLPRLNFPLEVDYIHATRYGNQTMGSHLQWRVKPRISLKNRTVLIVEDVLERGLTLAAIIHYCQKQGAQHAYTAVLLDKQGVSRLPGGLTQADFHALAMDKGFVFGYGMDYKGYLRNAPGIYLVAPEHDTTDIVQSYLAT